MICVNLAPRRTVRKGLGAALRQRSNGSCKHKAASIDVLGPKRPPESLALKISFDARTVRDYLAAFQQVGVTPAKTDGQ
jgi:hypothetical protein